MAERVDWTPDREPYPKRVTVDGLDVTNVFEVHVGEDGRGEVWCYGSPERTGARLYHDEKGLVFLAVRRYEGKIEVTF